MFRTHELYFSTVRSSTPTNLVLFISHILQRHFVIQQNDLYSDVLEYYACDYRIVSVAE
jgi:hypothetical protein